MTLHRFTYLLHTQAQELQQGQGALGDRLVLILGDQVGQENQRVQEVQPQTHLLDPKG